MTSRNSDDKSPANSYLPRITAADVSSKPRAMVHLKRHRYRACQRVLNPNRYSPLSAPGFGYTTPIFCRNVQRQRSTSNDGFRNFRKAVPKQLRQISCTRSQPVAVTVHTTIEIPTHRCDFKLQSLHRRPRIFTEIHNSTYQQFIGAACTSLNPDLRIPKQCIWLALRSLQSHLSTTTTPAFTSSSWHQNKAQCFAKAAHLTSTYSSLLPNTLETTRVVLLRYIYIRCSEWTHS